MFTFFNVVTVGSSVALKSLCPVRNRSNRKEKWTHWYFNLPEKRETVLRPLKKLHRCCQNHPFSLRYVDHKNVFSHKSTSEFLCFPCFSPDPVIFLKRLHVLISAEIWLHPSFFYQKEQKKGCLFQWVKIAWNKIKVVFLFSKCFYAGYSIFWWMTFSCMHQLVLKASSWHQSKEVVGWQKSFCSIQWVYVPGLWYFRSL